MSSTLTLGDGRKIDLKTKKIIGDPRDEQAEESAASSDAALPVLAPAPRQGIKLEDLPSAPKQMNVINAIIGYRLLGCSDADICVALGCDDRQLFAIVQSEAFDRSWNLCIDAFVKGQVNTAKDIISGAALHAAQTLVTVAKSSRNETNKMRASESILNRLGINEANADNAMSQGLIIKVVKDTHTSGVTIKID